MCDEREILLDDDQWDAFMAVLDQPPQVNARLARLFAEPSRIRREPERRP